MTGKTSYSSVLGGSKMFITTNKHLKNYDSLRVVRSNGSSQKLYNDETNLTVKKR